MSSTLPDVRRQNGEVFQGLRAVVTADVVRADGSSVHGDLGLGRLAAAGVGWSVLPEYRDPIPTAQLDGVGAVLSMGHIAFGADTFAAAPQLEIVSRFGAGYDTIDLAAATEAGVVVTNTPNAIRRHLGLAALTMLLSVAHNVVAKDAMTRRSDWDARERFRGAALEGRTLGILGFGSIGAELARMASPLGLRMIGSNRRGWSAEADELGVEIVAVDDLVAQADFLVVCVALTSETERIIDARQLARMKPSAYLINIGRGKLVDTDALRDALMTRQIAGAGLDVFDPEPLDPDDPLLSLDTVTLAPHALAWTADFTRDVSTAAIQAIIDVADGRRPAHALNPEVFDSEAWAAKQARRFG